jgi:predicted nucleic acid-binding Zn ribbon protein
MKICPRCISENPGDARYCEKCGYKFRSRTRITAVIIITVSLLIAAGAVIMLLPSPVDPVPLTPDDVVNEDTQSSSSSKFKYMPPAPENGVSKCIVEIRKTGLVSFIVKVDAQNRWRLEKSDLDSSLVKDDLVKNKKDISAGDYIAGITNYGVDKRNIRFVAAAGLETLAMTEIRNLGFAISLFDSREEIRWEFAATVPKQYEKSSFFVKISSGKTVIAWMEDETLQFKESPASDDKQTGRLAKEVPTNKRGYCFIAGDIPAKMAATHRSGNERYTVLNAPGTYNFTGAGEQNGLAVYRAVYEASGCNTFVYDWETNAVIGCLLPL